MPWTTPRYAAATLFLGLGAIGSCIVQVDSGAPSWNACKSNSDCTLEADSCCETCGEPSLNDVDAVNRDRLDQHFHDICPNPVPCPKCATARNPDLFATCRAGSCEALDIRRAPASACATDSDCRLRVTGCCECGGSTMIGDLIALNVGQEAAYEALVCDPSSACPACQPVLPPDAEAYCATDGHCAVRSADDCEAKCQAQGLHCCSGACVATYNDVFNCGECGNVCGGAHPYCDGSRCGTPACDRDGCGDPSFCCGSQCCAPGALCCIVAGPGPSLGPRCVTTVEHGTCPVGCPLCE